MRLCFLILHSSQVFLFSVQIFLFNISLSEVSTVPTRHPDYFTTIFIFFSNFVKISISEGRTGATQVSTVPIRRFEQFATIFIFNRFSHGTLISLRQLNMVANCSGLRGGTVDTSLDPVRHLKIEILNKKIST